MALVYFTRHKCIETNEILYSFPTFLFREPPPHACSYFYFDIWYPSKALRRKAVFGFVCKWPPHFIYSGGWKRDSLSVPGPVTVPVTVHHHANVPRLLFPHWHWLTTKRSPFVDFAASAWHVISMWEITLHPRDKAISDWIYSPK